MAKGGGAFLQRVAICFSAGVVGGLAVVLFSHLLFRYGVSQSLGVKAPASLAPPDIYRPLIWGGIWGMLFALLLSIKAVSKHYFSFGLLYFIAPVLGLYLYFLPARGMGYFGLEGGGPPFAIYLFLVNAPYGLVTATVARIIMGKNP